MNRLFSMFFLLFIAFKSYPQKSFKTETLYNSIKTLKIVVNDDFSSLPLINKNSNDILNISFDILEDNPQWLSYRIFHCDKYWNKSNQIGRAHV